MVVATYGNATVQNTATLWGDLSGHNLRAYVENRATQNIWVTNLFVQCGKATATNARIACGLYAVDAGMNPTTELCGTAYATVSTTKTGPSDGVWLNLPATVAARIISGTRYALAAHGVDANILIGMQDSASLGTVDDAQFYNESRATISLPNPFGAPDTVNIQGHLNVYAQGDVNVAPYQPGTNGSVMTPTSGANVTTTTPTFSVTFKDANQTLTGGLAGDYLSAYRLVVKDNAGNWIWDSGKRATTPAQQTAASASLTYPTAGTPGAQTLVNGTTYAYAFMVWDAFDAASVWSADQTFTVSQGGAFAQTVPANGTKFYTAQPSPFSATYTNPSGSALASAEIRLLDPATLAVLRTMPGVKTFTTAVVAGQTATILWSETGFSPNLIPGQAYRVQWRGTDQAAVQSTWYDGFDFTIDIPPNPPVALSPTSGTYTAPPLLTCQCTDTDDTPATGLIVKARIKNATGTVLATKLMGLRPGTDKQFDYQLQAADLVNGFATYTWDTYAYDGGFYSASDLTQAITAEANAVKSAQGTFVYVAPPTLTSTLPTTNQAVTTDVPIYAWTVSTTQAKFRVRVARAADGAAVYDSGTVASANHFWQQPPGKLRNGISYTWTLTVTDTNGLVGTLTVPFSLQYPPPPTLALTLATVLRPGDVVPTGVDLTWPASADPHFQQYLITRRNTVDVDAGGYETTLCVIGAAGTTEWVDDSPAAGVAYTYSLIQQVAAGSQLTDVVSSLPSTQTVTLGFTQCIIANAIDPLLGRVVLEGRTTRTYRRNRSQKLLVPWNLSAPYEFKDATNYPTIANEFVIADPDAARAAWQTLSALDAGDDPILYRDGRSYEAEGAIFGTISNLQLVDDPGGVPQRIQIEVTKTAAQPDQTKPLLPVLPALPPPPPLIAPVPGTLATPPVQTVPIPPVLTVSNPNALAHWTVLHLLLLNTSIGGVANKMSAAEQSAALHVINQFPSTMDALSGGRVQILQTVADVTATVTKQTLVSGDTYWLQPSDIATILFDNKASRFDDVFVYVANEGVNAAPYLGLSYSAAAGGYHYIPVTAAANWANPNVLVHEWLHEAMFMLKARGFPVPADSDLNAGGVGSEKRGAQGTAYSIGPLDSTYLGDVLTGNVLKNGTASPLLGGTVAAWKSGGGGGAVTGTTTSGTVVVPVSTPPPTTVGTPPAGSPWSILTPSNPSNVNGVDYRLLGFPVKLQWVPVGQTNQRPGLAMTPSSTTYHDTGNSTAGENSQSEANWILAGAPGGTDAQVSVHFFVDDTQAIQLIPITEVAWHAGDQGGPGNMTSIAIEQCIGSTLNQAKVRSNCAQLHALLAHHMGWDVHLTAGTDVATAPNGHVVIAQHHHWSGKDCPGQIRGLGLWSQEVAAVNTFLGK